MYSFFVTTSLSFFDLSSQSQLKIIQIWRKKWGGKAVILQPLAFFFPLCLVCMYSRFSLSVAVMVYKALKTLNQGILSHCFQEKCKVRSCKPLGAEVSSTDQQVTLFEVCFCSKTFFFFFWHFCPLGMWKFLSQGSNLHHNKPNHSSDNPDP